MTRLDILASHRIQYYASWFRYLDEWFDVEVLYGGFRRREVIAGCVV